jgi:DNA repair exonuclease SbcCD ATPase subunit
MPVKDYECEFCCEVIRKDRIAKHVKDNHKVEIGKYLLEVYDGNKPDSKMNDFLGKYLTNGFENVEIIMGFASDKYSENAEEYLFGANPFFYSGTPQDDKEVFNYKKSKANIQSHYKFLEECINTIPISQFIRCQRKADITSQGNIEFLKQKSSMRNTIKELEGQVEKLTRINQNLTTSEKKANEKAIECSELLGMDIEEITTMRSNNRYLTIENNRLNNAITNQKRIIDDINNEWEDRFSSMSQMKMREIEELYKQVEELTKQNDKVKGKIQEAAEKIVQKEKDKRRKEKEKEKKKAKEAKKKAEEAKALAKLRSKKSNKKSYDSDSSDSSDSDSSSSSSSDSDSD